ncbi:MAG TPA: hypothetical protein VFV38_34905 [Ktedonobacteraceae bacterium]|nr:hypothetical protein [Ktedonobacteraceae bacterium]
MKRYCKAYLLKDLRQFSHWREIAEEGEETLADETIVYLWDDLSVVRTPVLPEQQNLCSQITPQWRTFCNETLHFDIPEDARFLHEGKREAYNIQEGTEKKRS